MHTTMGMRAADGADLELETGAHSPRREADGLIGDVLVARGRMEKLDVERVSAYSKKRGLRFGEAAVKLGLISRHDVDLALAVQFDYPYLDKGAGGVSTKLVAAFEPFGAKGDAIRLLRSQLMRLWFSKGHRALALVGPSGRDGCSYVAANLAVAFSQLGEKTVLIDADLRDPAQHKLFNVDNGAGLSAALAGRIPTDSITVELPLFRNLSLVPAGIRPPNIYDLFARLDLDRVLSELGNRYSIILIDAPAFASHLGADLIAHHCGGALMVLRNGHTRLTEARGLATALKDAEAEVVGATLTHF